MDRFAHGCGSLRSLYVTNFIARRFARRLPPAQLRNLEYDISEPGAIERFAEAKGVGDSGIRKLREFVATGRSRRLESMNKDKKRCGIKNLTAVWGIGPAMASNLVAQNVFDRDTLKKLVANGQIKLDFRQKIGLKYVEEIEVPIPRSQVSERANESNEPCVRKVRSV